MNCPFSTGEVFTEISCTGTNGAIDCPFVDECNDTMMWDTISKYIRIGIETYELAKEKNMDLVDLMG